MEGKIVSEALERAGHNVTAAARLLGTSRETLRYRVNKYGLKSVERAYRNPPSPGARRHPLPVGEG